MVETDERASSWDLPLLQSSRTAAAAASASPLPPGLSRVPPTQRPPSDAGGEDAGASLRPQTDPSSVVPPPPSAVIRGIGQAHFMLHSIDLDATEFPKPIDTFFLMKWVMNKTWMPPTPTHRRIIMTHRACHPGLDRCGPAAAPYLPPARPHGVCTAGCPLCVRQTSLAWLCTRGRISASGESRACRASRRSGGKRCGMTR